jgi:hypothetical protein
MEKMTKGLALEELEAHAHAALLPDRIELRRGNKKKTRITRGNVRCDVTNVAGLDVVAENFLQCQRINA